MWVIYGRHKVGQKLHPINFEIWNFVKIDRATVFHKSEEEMNQIVANLSERCPNMEFKYRKMQVTDLIPLNSRQKSFYGKAQVIEAGEYADGLKSYDTIVCIVDHEEPGITKIAFPWSGWSPTTARHVTEFLTQEGISVSFLMQQIQKHEKGIKSFKQLMENVSYIEFGKNGYFYYDDSKSRGEFKDVNNFINNYS